MPNLLRLAAWSAALVGLALLIRWLFHTALFLSGFYSQ
jgi:hypothetical protein